jgi:hypothetical protein
MSLHGSKPIMHQYGFWAAAKRWVGLPDNAIEPRPAAGDVDLRTCARLLCSPSIPPVGLNATGVKSIGTAMANYISFT